MESSKTCTEIEVPGLMDISDEDVYKAMKKLKGYLDITTGDFKEVYRLAHQEAIDRIMRNIKVKNLMTKDVIYVYKKTPLIEVAETMAKGKVSGVPVVDESQKVAGVLSEKDFIKNLLPNNAASFMSIIAECLKTNGCCAIQIRSLNAEDIMSAPPITAHLDTPIWNPIQAFRDKAINRMPVVNEKGVLEGIITRTDVLKFFIPFMESKICL